MEGKYTGKRLVHSDAEIEARVWYSKTKKESFVQDERQITGNSEKKYEININNFKINLYKSLPKFENYDTISTNKKMKLFSDFYLPIQLDVNEYKEIEIIHKEYSYDELKNKLISDIELQLNNEIENDSKIINKQINEKNIDGELEIEVIYEVLENIGVSQKIEEENINVEEILDKEE